VRPDRCSVHAWLPAMELTMGLWNAGGPLKMRSVRRHSKGDRGDRRARDTRLSLSSAHSTRAPAQARRFDARRASRWPLMVGPSEGRATDRRSRRGCDVMVAEGRALPTLPRSLLGLGIWVGKGWEGVLK